MSEKGKSQEVTPAESAKIKLIVLLSMTPVVHMNFSTLDFIKLSKRAKKYPQGVF